jgi:hypothetical protein
MLKKHFWILAKHTSLVHHGNCYFTVYITVEVRFGQSYDNYLRWDAAGPNVINYVRNL